MATITFKGNPVHTSGTLPTIGSTAPDFLLTKTDLSDASLKDFHGRVKILNITPSLDTSVCALSAKKFNAEAASIPGLLVLNVSRDLPFAANRFCKTEGVDKVISLSELRNRDFGSAYGLAMTDGPLAGLLSRAVVVLDAADRVVYAEQVPEIAQEPNYQAALEAAQKAAAGS